jgi:hypothetical protein
MLGIVIVAAIVLVASLSYEHNSAASSVSQPLHEAGQKSQPAATATETDNIEQHTALTADQQTIVSEANQLLIQRLGTTTFQSMFKYSQIIDGGGGIPPEYNVLYQFSPTTDPGESFTQGVDIYAGTDTDTYQTNISNVYSLFPDCATYLELCRIVISKSRALQIAQDAVAGNWSGHFRFDLSNESPSYQRYAWFLTTDEETFGCHQFMEIDAISGDIIHVNRGCDEPLP